MGKEIWAEELKDPNNDDDPSHIPRIGDIYIFSHKTLLRFFAVVLDKTDKTVKFGKIPSIVKEREQDEDGNNIYIIIPEVPEEEDEDVEGGGVTLLRKFRCYKKSFKEDASIMATDSNMKCRGVPYSDNDIIKTQSYC